MISILSEPAYAHSIWGKELLKSLTDRLRQKRIPFSEVFDSIEKTDGVFIIASDYNWIKSVILKLNAEEIKPILICNQSKPITGCEYSCVCSDINGSMRYLVNELKEAGKTRVALYGVNANSISDIGRADGLFAFKDEAFEKMEMFKNNGSLENCFNDFLKEYMNFDAVICANDFAAVSLVRNMQKNVPSALKNIKILSCAQTGLSAYYRDRITSVNMNFKEYGKAAVFIWEKLKAHPYMSQITVSVKWNDAVESTEKSVPIMLTDFESEHEFYSDEEMREMLIAEQILNMCSDTDELILKLLADGQTTEEIGKECFLTEGGVKYRIKRILGECGLSNRNELAAIIKKYLYSE